MKIYTLININTEKISSWTQLEVAVDQKLRTNASEGWEWELNGYGLMRPLELCGHSAAWIKMIFFALSNKSSHCNNFYKQKYKIYNRHLVSSQMFTQINPYGNIMSC